MKGNVWAIVNKYRVIEKEFGDYKNYHSETVKHIKC
jgi:hypothetical protein